MFSKIRDVCPDKAIITSATHFLDLSPYTPRGLFHALAT